MQNRNVKFQRDELEDLQETKQYEQVFGRLGQLMLAIARPFEYDGKMLKCRHDIGRISSQVPGGWQDWQHRVRGVKGAMHSHRSGMTRQGCSSRVCWLVPTLAERRNGEVFRLE